MLTQPYAKATLGYPVYLDGLAFAGLVSLQTIEQNWPATASLVDDTISIEAAFERSTHTTQVMDETQGE